MFEIFFSRNNAYFSIHWIEHTCTRMQLNIFYDRRNVVSHIVSNRYTWMYDCMIHRTRTRLGARRVSHYARELRGHMVVSFRIRDASSVNVRIIVPFLCKIVFAMCARDSTVNTTVFVIFRHSFAVTRNWTLLKTLRRPRIRSNKIIERNRR